MEWFPVIAFLNIGLPETLVIAGGPMMLFAPGAARMLGGLARTLFEVKRGVDHAKQDLTRTVSREIHSAIGGVDEEVEKRRKKRKREEA